MIQRIRELSFGIRTLEDLKAHLQVAIELEHATIPPYLCALYSIPQGTNYEAASILRSVVMEEMLHLTLAANVLTAIGGTPQVHMPGFIQKYPMTLPHSEGDFIVDLSRFSPSAIDTFLKIERPASAGAPAQSDHYTSIGQFYAAISDGLKAICKNDKHFNGDPARQVGPEHYYNGGGHLFPVTGLRLALAALEEIVEQGEGFEEERSRVHGRDGKLGHFYRFNEIREKRRYRLGDTPETGPTGDYFSVDYSSVYPMVANPSLARYEPGSELLGKSAEFARAYSASLQNLQASLSGDPGLLQKSTGSMLDLKYRAVELMRIPFEDGTAGPCFEFVTG